MQHIEFDIPVDFRPIFKATCDKKNSFYETVGTDENGRLILRTEAKNHSSGQYDFFELSSEEFIDFVKKARANRLISFFKMKKLLKSAENDDIEPPPADIGGNIESFETVTLRESGMRGITEEEITIEDGEAKVASYIIRWDGSQEVRSPQKTSVVPVNEVLDLLNKCRIGSWDGFDGPHPKGVLDGIMFRFNANVNGGKHISARGSQNFPKNYRDFTDGLYRFLNPKQDN